MAHKNIGEALLAVQAEATTLQKNAINPHFKNAYISLDELVEQILPILNKNGVVLLQWPTALSRTTEQDGPITLGTEPALRTKLLHAASGTSFEDTMPLMLAKDDPQGQGSAITYARRYALMAALSLVADVDDDAQSTKAAPARVSRSSGSSTSTTSAGSAAL